MRSLRVRIRLCRLHYARVFSLPPLPSKRRRKRRYKHDCDVGGRTKHRLVHNAMTIAENAETTPSIDDRRHFNDNVHITTGREKTAQRLHFQRPQPVPCNRFGAGFGGRGD